jgi:hypothetical protein
VVVLATEEAVDAVEVKKLKDLKLIVEEDLA